MCHGIAAACGLSNLRLLHGMLENMTGSTEHYNNSLSKHNTDSSMSQVLGA